MKNYYYFKCGLDFIFALLAMVALFPVFIVISFFIKIDSKGPVLFIQERLGQNGKIFKIYKFRTMVQGAINLKGGIHTYEGDSRITRVGSFLRKTSLDELPQIFNIFKGDMSVIGPRPPLPYYPKTYQEYNQKQIQRFLIKPGVTGYAQVIFRNSVSWDERIKYDLIYFERLSLFFDIKIFFKTIYVVLKRKNIY